MTIERSSIVGGLMEFDKIEVVEPTIAIPRLLCIFFCSGRVTIKAYVRPELLNI